MYWTRAGVQTVFSGVEKGIYTQWKETFQKMLWEREVLVENEATGACGSQLHKLVSAAYISIGHFPRITNDTLLSI